MREQCAKLAELTRSPANRADLIVSPGARPVSAPISQNALGLDPAAQLAKPVATDAARPDSKVRQPAAPSSSVVGTRYERISLL